MTTQDSQSELDDIFNEHVENIQEGVVSAIQVGENVDYHTFDAKVELREAIEAYVTTQVKEAEELLKAEVKFLEERRQMERNKYDILAKATEGKIKEAERLARIDELNSLPDCNIESKYHGSTRVVLVKDIVNRIEALTTTTNGKEE